MNTGKQLTSARMCTQVAENFVVRGHTLHLQRNHYIGLQVEGNFLSNIKCLIIEFCKNDNDCIILWNPMCLEIGNWIIHFLIYFWKITLIQGICGLSITCEK